MWAENTACVDPNVTARQPTQVAHSCVVCVCTTNTGTHFSDGLCLAQSRDASVEQPEVLWESMSTLSVPLKHGGRWNGIAYWFEVSPDVRP